MYIHEDNCWRKLPYNSIYQRVNEPRVLFCIQFDLRKTILGLLIILLCLFGGCCKTIFPNKARRIKKKKNSESSGTIILDDNAGMRGTGTLRPDAQYGFYAFICNSLTNKYNNNATREKLKKYEFGHALSAWWIYYNSVVFVE